MNSLKLRKKIDPLIPTIGVSLSIVGLIMVLSASQIVAADRFDNQYHFFVRQLIAWVIGMMAFFYFSKVKLEKLFDNKGTLLIIAIISLILVFFPVIGGKINGVYRWIGVGFFSFQPSEFVKLFLIIYFAGLFAVKGESLKTLKAG
ncbi:MAG: FtsW/RodA/SpoVE family cell cycle protein, partial [Patescibacteria group bacterium]